MAANAEAQMEPPLFAKLSMPVYSLSTDSGASGPSSGDDQSQGHATMNLVTYAAPVSIKPRRYAVGLYLGTLSHENFKATGRGVLQVLRQPHAQLFQLLGKTSGRGEDKVQLIRDAGFQVVERFGLPTLSDAACVMELKAVSDLMPCGDHEVVICDVVAYENVSRPADASPEAALAAVEDVLYTGFLRQLGHMQ